MKVLGTNVKVTVQETFVKVPVRETFMSIQIVWILIQYYFINPHGSTFRFHLYVIVVYCLKSTTHRYLIKPLLDEECKWMLASAN